MKAVGCLVLLSGCIDWSAFERTQAQTSDADGGPAVASDGASQSDADPRDMQNAPDTSTPPTADMMPAVDDMTAPPRDMACASPHTHSNGLGQTWTDCISLGTYNENQALTACGLSYESCVDLPGNSCNGIAVTGINSGSSQYNIWVFSGTYAGKVLSTNNCTTPTATGDWN